MRFGKEDFLRTRSDRSVRTGWVLLRGWSWVGRGVEKFRTSTFSRARLTASGGYPVRGANIATDCIAPDCENLCGSAAVVYRLWASAAGDTCYSGRCICVCSRQRYRELGGAASTNWGRDHGEAAPHPNGVMRDEGDGSRQQAQLLLSWVWYVANDASHVTRSG